MVCIPCIVIPVLLWIFHKYIQPIILKFWNPWASKSVSAPTDSGGGESACDTVSYTWTYTTVLRAQLRSYSPCITDSGMPLMIKWVAASLYCMSCCCLFCQIQTYRILEQQLKFLRASHAGIVSKRLNILSCFLHRTVLGSDRRSDHKSAWKLIGSDRQPDAVIIHSEATQLVTIL